MIGTRMRLIREGLGVNLEEAARRTGVSVATLSRMENGRQGFTESTIKKIAKGYGVDPDEFFFASKQREVPVLNVSEMEPVFVSLGKLKNFIKKLPAITEDPNAFYIVAEGAQLRNFRIATGDLLLVEPSIPIKNGSRVVALVHNKVMLGQYFETNDQAFLQPESNMQVPTVLPKKVRMFRITKLIVNT